jgi:hypothetical protein
MTKTLKTLLLALALSAYGNVALAHAEHGQPQHGGVVAEAGEMQFEVVGKDGLAHCLSEQPRQSGARCRRNRQAHRTGRHRQKRVRTESGGR